jgi:hypothetical protein
LTKRDSRHTGTSSFALSYVNVISINPCKVYRHTPGLEDSISTIYGKIDQEIGSDLALSSRFVVGCWGGGGWNKREGRKKTV